MRISQAAAVEFIELVTNLITAHFAEGGDRVVIRGFGMFERITRGAFVTSHPTTGKRIVVRPTNSIGFKPGPITKRRINS
jgi:nucleoid DNA-binding protein